MSTEGIDPRLDYLEHEEAVLLDDARVDDAALEARVALVDQGRADPGPGHPREAEPPELSRYCCDETPEVARARAV